MMIKKIFSLFAFLFMVFAIQAQDQSVNSRVSYGISAGYGDVQFKSDSSFPYVLPGNPGVGDSFFAGVFMDVPLNESFVFKPELNYYISNKSTGYLEVAPLLKYYLFNSGFNIIGGPQARIILTEVDDIYRRTGFELAGGLGYDFDRSWYVQAKYAYELTNRYKEGVPTGGSEMHFETLTVGLGFRF